MSRASQEFPCILQNPKVHYRIHKCQTPVPILSQTQLDRTSRSHLLRISFNIIFLSTLGLQTVSLKYEAKKFIEFRESIYIYIYFISNVHFAAHIAVPWTVPPRAAAKLAPALQLRLYICQRCALKLTTVIYIGLKVTPYHRLRVFTLKLQSSDPLNTNRRPLYLKTQSVPRCKHFSSRL